MTALEELFASRIAVVVPDVVGTAAAAEVRARLERTGYTRYGLVDRGSYDLLTSPAEPALLAALVGVAAKVTGRTLVVSEARALRLRAGDYLLAHHDRVHADHPVELVLDLSATSVPGAEVHYRRAGQVSFRVTSTPGALAVVERGPTVTCNHTYLSKLHPEVEVVRLVVLLRDS
ncbi:MAG: hypothetical protein H0T79_07190 [Deltaproteobacteria bacterium]|nr:hypothetical protein [Deltaproteobacteria bacterium]